MARIEQAVKAWMAAFAKGTHIERVTDDPDVREWLVLGRIAMFFCLWAAMIIPVLLVIWARY